MQLPPHLVDLIQDALLKSYWRKPALKGFLRRMHISEQFLAQLSESETKRQWLHRLFPQLERSDKGKRLIRTIGDELARQTRFPDLGSWEDSDLKIKEATEAVRALKAYLQAEAEDVEEQRKAAERRAAADAERLRIITAKGSLTAFRRSLDELFPLLGTSPGGIAFQDWFYDLMAFSDVDHRRPYKTEGREIDGSITIDGTTYLAELKFTASQIGAGEIDSIVMKVNNKSDNTMGVFVSMSGYSSVAIRQASFSKSPLLLLDHSHLYMVLGDILPFVELIRRVRRHSSQEGKAYLPVNEFGGR